MRGRTIHTIHHDYFNSIDSSLKAYILGFFMADGTIEVNQSKKYCIRFVQKEEDFEILSLIQREISPESKIGIITRGTKKYGRLSITSWELGSALIALGLTPRKTYCEFLLPSIPSEFYKDLIRGYFDGDGTSGVYISKPGYVVRQVRITSYSKTVLENIQNLLKKEQIQTSILISRGYYILSIKSYKEWYSFLYPGITTFKRKQENCALCTLTSSEIKSLKSLDPRNA